MSYLPIERYEYDAYGKAHILDDGADNTWFTADDTELSSSAKGNPYLFTGRRVDILDGGSLTLQYSRNRYYSYDMGRWLSQDPLGTVPSGDMMSNPFRPLGQYTDSLSLYEYVRSTPVNAFDPWGLWGSYVHNNCTSRWARGGTVGFKPQAANLVGKADADVDSGKTGPLPGGIPIIGGDQSYHFNTYNRDGSSNDVGDSRLVLVDLHFAEAKRQCSPKIDLPRKSAVQLGTALHPLQDWVAHGDHGMKELIDLFFVHNGKSLQKEYGSPGGYPDNIDLDAGGRYGRADKSVLIFIPSTSGRQSDYAIYKENQGHRRLTHTRKLTQEKLLEFRRWLISHGGCECKKFFLLGH